MMPETLKGLRVRASVLCQHARAAFGRLPKNVRVAIVGGAALLMLIGLYTTWSSVQRDAILHLKVQHNFHSAQVEVLVDGDTVYSGKTYGSMRKKFGLFSEGVQGSMSQSIPVTSGEHEILVRVAADDGTIHEDSIKGEFVSKTTRDLGVSARHGGLELSWQGSGAVAAASAPTATPAQPAPNPSWLSRYATTIMLSVMGSMVSALTGFAIRELPGRIRGQSPAPMNVTVDEKPQARSAAAGT